MRYHWLVVRLEAIDEDELRELVFDGRLQLLEYVPTVLSGPPRAARVG